MAQRHFPPRQLCGAFAQIAFEFSNFSRFGSTASFAGPLAARALRRACSRFATAVCSTKSLVIRARDCAPNTIFRPVICRQDCPRVVRASLRNARFGSSAVVAQRRRYGRFSFNCGPVGASRRYRSFVP
jgi:hypothetical protein